VLLRFFFKGKVQLTLLVALFSSISTALFANELEFTPKVKTTGYIYETQVGSQESEREQAISIEPSILTTFSSKVFSAALAVNHTRVERKSDDSALDTSLSDETNSSFTELDYSSNLTLIENVMNLSFNGSQNYRIVSQDQNFFADKILDSGDLTKSQRHGATFNFTTPNPRYIGLNFQTNYSKIDTEESISNLGGIDGTNLSSNIRLFQGNHAESYSFDISAQYNDTTRSQLQDFSSTLIQGTIGVALNNNTQFIVVGSSQKYDADLSSSAAQRTNLDTTSYGVGIQWKPQNERIVKLTYNQLDERENNTNYLGLEIDWALSSRTAIQADYSKKFYGDAYGLNFDYKLKAFRSSVQYNEEVTTFSRLSSTGNTGVFVCELGSVDLTTCFQPDSINYVLQVGEEFRNVTQFDTDISEEVLFRKTGSINLGYDKRKLKTSLNMSYSETEYLESSRVQTSKSILFNISYTLSKKTDLTFSAKRSQRDFGGAFVGEVVTTVSLGMDREFGRNLKLNWSARMLDRSRDDNTDPDRPEVTDKRLTLGLLYTF
jgi:uncharacterized protein (PEP-CTERM system associated)